jgi:hypothetical protein
MDNILIYDHYFAVLFSHPNLIKNFKGFRDKVPAYIKHQPHALTYERKRNIYIYKYLLFRWLFIFYELQLERSD